MLSPTLLSLAMSALLGLTASAAAAPKRHQQIQRGPYVSASVVSDWPRMNMTFKGIAVRLRHDGRDAGAVLYDTDLMRLSSGWVGGFVAFPKDLTSVRDERGVIPVGTQTLGTRARPGWADPLKPGRDEGFDDPRDKPDGSPMAFGPMPKRWLQYEGLSLHGDRVVLRYRVGSTKMLESPGVIVLDGANSNEQVSSDQAIITRTLNIAATTSALRLLITEREGAAGSVLEEGRIAVLRRATSSVGRRERLLGGDKPRVTVSRGATNYRFLSMGGPSARDAADRRAPRATDKQGKRLPPPLVYSVPGYAAEHIDSEPKPGNALPTLHDGSGGRSANDKHALTWFDGLGARVVMDLQRSIDVGRIESFSWGNDANQARQAYELYGSNGLDDGKAGGPRMPSATAGQPQAVGWTKLATVDSADDLTDASTGGMHGVSIDKPGETLGRFRYLLWVMKHDATRFAELDVYDAVGFDKNDAATLKKDEVTAVALIGGAPGATLRVASRNEVRLFLPPGAPASKLVLAHWTGPSSQFIRFRAAVAKLNAAPVEDLAKLTRGGPRRWPETVTTQGQRSERKQAYVLDTLTLPQDNPYGAWFRPGGFDFFSDGQTAAVCNWDGDVWIVRGIDDALNKLTWQRYATGLFQPLGLKIVDDVVYVHGRDQVTKLHDRNGDGEADDYECFNNDVHVTWNFHEFAFDLQTDAKGNFYLAKGSPVRNGGHGFETISSHHGTVMRLSPDGKAMSIVATGLRAPNGIGVRRDGLVTTGDNEGSWVPKCRLNWAPPPESRPGVLKGVPTFHGVVPAAHQRITPKRYDPPICFFPKNVDNSSGGQVWVTSDKWGPLRDRLLHLSYGQSTMYSVLMEAVKSDEHPGGEVMQGGVVAFPLRFASGCLRARFNPRDGQLYVCGLKGWQTNAAKDGCLQRVRYTGATLRMPMSLSVKKDRVVIGFSCKLDREEATDTGSYAIEQWNYLWANNYGSSDYSVKDPSKKTRDKVEITKAELSADGKTVTLFTQPLGPVDQMRVRIELLSADDEDLSFEIHNTVHAAGD